MDPEFTVQDNPQVYDAEGNKQLKIVSAKPVHKDAWEAWDV